MIWRERKSTGDGEGGRGTGDEGRGTRDGDRGTGDGERGTGGDEASEDLMSVVAVVGEAWGVVGEGSIKRLVRVSQT
jgi:hypothetical protein